MTEPLVFFPLHGRFDLSGQRPQLSDVFGGCPGKRLLCGEAFQRATDLERFGDIVW